MDKTKGELELRINEMEAVNGVIVTIRSDDEDSEYVYDTDRKALKFVKDLLDTRVKEKVAE